MFIELIDVLRCPNPHEESWLVLAARDVGGRDVMEGTLGCPICRGEFPIVAGIARFDSGAARLTLSATPDEAEALRLAALLDLAEPRSYAVLVGATSVHAPLVVAMTDVQLMLVNPPLAISMGHGLSGLTTPSDREVFPLAQGTARGVALDGTATAEFARAAVDVLRPGGRLVAPVSVQVPPGVSVLTRDDRHWVAERAHVARASGIIPLARRR